MLFFVVILFLSISLGVTYCFYYISRLMLSLSQLKKADLLVKVLPDGQKQNRDAQPSLLLLYYNTALEMLYCNTLPPCQTCSIHPQVVQSLQHNLRQSFIQYNECQALKLYPIQVFLKGFVCFQQLIRKFHKQLKKFLRYSKQCVHSYYIESDKKQNASNVGSSKCFRVLLTDTVKCPIKL